MPIQDSLFRGLGGISSVQILARRQQRDFLLHQTVDYRKAFLYLLGGNNFSNYVFFAEPIIQNGGDITSYIDRLNEYKQQYYSDHTTQLTFQDLKRRAALMFFLDPFNYHALYSSLVNYLILGKTSSKLHTIPVGEVQYIPYYYLSLTIFGTSHHIKNYIVWREMIFDVDIFFSDKTFDTYDGFNIGIYNLDILSLLNQNSFFSLDILISLSRQPLVVTRPGGGIIKRKDRGLAGLFQIGIFFSVPSWEDFGIYTEVGWKTAGYWEGYFPEEGLLFQLGLRFYLE